MIFIPVNDILYNQFHNFDVQKKVLHTVKLENNKHALTISNYDQ